MKRLFILFLTTLLYICGCSELKAQDYPYINPTGTYTDDKGNETTLQGGEKYSGAAPLAVHFQANVSDADGWSSHFEWRFYTEQEPNTPYLTRYEEDTDYTFVTAGSHIIKLYAIFTQGNDVIEYTDDYWQTEGKPLTFGISESKLTMPNAFSPNNDGHNDTYKPKKGFQSIVEFHATIYNRWGTKLYEWSDINADGWDGKYKGKDVPDGVYYVNVRARGADGRVFNIRRDVNLMRGYTESTTTTTEE